MSGGPCRTEPPVGNRLSRTSGSTTTSTYDRADRFTAVGGTAVTVGAAGNLTARGADTFAYDAAGRLASASVAGTTESYAYDGDGTRVSRRVGTGPLTSYVNDPAPALPLLLSDGTRTYVYGVGLAYAVAGSTLEVYHADRLGSVRELTNGAGTVTATYRADEWGIPTGGSGSSTQPFGYTGEPRDGTGLVTPSSRATGAGCRPAVAKPIRWQPHGQHPPLATPPRRHARPQLLRGGPAGPPPG